MRATREPVRLEPRQVGGLVLVPLRHDDPPVRVVEVRPLELAALDAELELRQVRAGEMVREVGRREPERAVSRESHHLECQLSRGARLRRPGPAAHRQRLALPGSPFRERGALDHAGTFQCWEM